MARGVIYFFAKKYTGEKGLRLKARVWNAWKKELKRRKAAKEDTSEFTEPYFKHLLIEKGLEFFENQDTNAEAE